MSVLQRLATSLRRQGPTTTVAKLWTLAGDYLFDIRYGTDTCAWSALDQLTIDGENKERGHHYQPTRVIPLRRFFAAIQPMIPADSVLVDLGCGKGRVLLVASEFGFKEVRGVEFAHELCEIARRNSTIYKARTGVRTECRILECDVTNYTIGMDENVFFLFNPFDDTILSKVISNIAASLQTRRRKVLIIYYLPTGARVFDQQSHFVPVRQFNIWGYHFTVYSNVD